VRQSKLKEKEKCCMVLLIDDERVVREIGRDMINSIGFGCITASNGKDALKLYKKQIDRVDVVLLDVKMPKMSGEKVYRELKIVNPEVKVIITSGYSQKYIEEEYFKEPVLHFVSKPFKIDAIEKKLKEMS
jgi:YesN/AraC family two-component response regulator